MHYAGLLCHILRQQLQISMKYIFQNVSYIIIPFWTAGNIDVPTLLRTSDIGDE